MSCIPINDFSLISLCDATKAGKLYSIVPDTGAGDFDVTRASTATYLGSDGLLKTAATNEPRIEFNPDGSYKGLLVEPAATNLVLRSEEFDDAVWALAVGGTNLTPNNAVAPDGNQTADTLFFASSPISRIFQNIVLTNNTYTVSIFAKSSNNKKFRFRIRNSANQDEFSTDFETTSQWQRFTFTISQDISQIAVTNESSGITGEIEIWGAQLETGSVATSYIPTVASTVTRAADVISRTGASGLIGQTEGTLYVEVDVRNYFTNQLRTLLSVIGNLNIQLEVSTNGNFVFRIGSLVNVNVGNVSNLNGILKIAVVYNTSTGGTLYINGSIIDNLTGATGITDLDNIGVGIRSTNNDRHLGDHIKSFAILPTALSEQAAINLTS